MKHQYLSDAFLKKVIEILNLPSDFKYNTSTLHTNISITSNQKIQLKQLCDENSNLRINHNDIKPHEKIRYAKTNDIYFSKWSYTVLKIYFNLYL